MNSVQHARAWLLLLHGCAAYTFCKLSCTPDDLCRLLRSLPKPPNLKTLLRTCHEPHCHAGCLPKFCVKQLLNLPKQQQHRDAGQVIGYVELQQHLQEKRA